MSFFSLSTSYQQLVLKKPKSVLFILMLSILFFGYHASKFRLDASADTLVLENDHALQFYRQVQEKFASDNVLILTYTPNNGKDLFSKSVLADLAQLSDQLTNLDNIDSVMNILNVPLIESPLVTLEQLTKRIRTLSDNDTQVELARNELSSSPIYKDLIISRDQQTTAILLNLARNARHHELQKQRQALRNAALINPLTNQQQQQLLTISQEYTELSAVIAEKEKILIDNIRQIIEPYRSNAQLYLGGVAMITADSIAFVKNDLATFSIGIIAFIILLLIMAFRKPRWVILPIITCTATAVVMIGFLGLVDWPVTVISSNFLSLLLIITLSLTIHLIVRYRELQSEQPELDAETLIAQTINKKFIPCFYTAFTTIVAFSSLIISEIRPIIDFGWMMSIGIIVAFILAFTLFPCMLMLLKPTTSVSSGNFVAQLSHQMAIRIEKYHSWLLLVFIAFTLISILGINKLTVENRFIDYYKESTEIYQGMELIDHKLGGTTPLDVVINAPAYFYAEQQIEPPVSITSDQTASYSNASVKMDTHQLAEEAFDEEAFDEEEFDEEEFLEEQTVGDITSTSYWFNTYQLKQVAKIHNYLDNLEQTGKVLSLENSMAMLRKIDAQVANDSFLLALLYQSVPDILKNALFAPYMSADGNEIRFSIRLFESDVTLQRNELITQIQSHLIQQLGLEPQQVQLTGMAVMYNNMLQSLFRSQILTIGVVFFAILLMFILLFRSLTIALIALIPNLISAAFILGIMGWTGIPLDLMTITIAAISIGIAVDNSIHYTHRFIDEYQHRKDYWQTVKACHASIGQAIYFTSITITLGFGLLVLSSFIPTIYFGVLTGFAMLVALLANLSLLPILLVKFKPLDKPKSHS